jgi:hypothetical protein
MDPDLLLHRVLDQRREDHLLHREAWALVGHHREEDRHREDHREGDQHREEDHREEHPVLTGFLHQEI